MRLVGGLGVRGLARRMCASSGVTSPSGSAAKSGIVGLDLAAERRAVCLVPTDQRLLLAQRRAVPELDEHPDDRAPTWYVPPTAHAGLAVAGADPHVLVHQLVVARVEVGRAVVEPHQVAHAGLARLGLRCAG